MANLIQISVGNNQCLQALHYRPEERSTLKLDQLLIVMVHGFPGNKESHENAFKDLEHLISHKNYHTLRFDFRGCGESDGREEDFSLKSASEDLDHVFSWARKQGYKRFIIVAEGLGAPLSIKSAPEETECFVFLWPMLDLPLIAKKVFKVDDIDDEWKKAGYILMEPHRIGVPFLKALSKTNITSILEKLDKPLMVMHGARDDVTPIEQIELIRKHVQSRRVEITSFQDGTHGLPQRNHRQTMFYHIMQFIEKYA